MTTLMTEAALPATFNATAFQRMLAVRQEPDWLQDRRKAAFALFQEKSGEELDPEEFKRVDLRAFRPEKFAIRLVDPATSTSADSFRTLLQDRTEFGGATVHVDGGCVKQELSQDLKQQGVLFGDLRSLLVSHRELLEPHLCSSAVPVGTDRFSAWHAAFMTGGTVLYVPRNVELKQPLYSLIGLATDGAADFSHTLIILEDGAVATLLEETASWGAANAGLHIGVVELIVGQGAQLRYVQLQNWNDKTFHIAHQAARIARDAAVQWTIGGLGSKLAHTHQEVYLDGPGASAEVNGVTFATDRQTISYYTQQTHIAPHTRSDLLYKDVLRDRSRVIWRGMIKVAEGAQKTDGYQRNDGLLLNPEARADAIPGLEIEADDVRCTHGATVGQVDEEQIFYCMCRGLSRREAMHVIVEGFFQRVYDRIPVPAVQETLSQAVQRKLGIG